MEMRKIFIELICIKSAGEFQFGTVYATNPTEPQYVMGQHEAVRLHPDMLGAMPVLATESGAVFAKWSDFEGVWNTMIEGFSAPQA